MCPEYYNTEIVEYTELLKWSSTCKDYGRIEAYEDETFLSSTKSYLAVSQSIENSYKELPDIPEILKDLAISLFDFRVFQTKKELIFLNYYTYMKYCSFKETFHFIPKRYI